MSKTSTRTKAETALDKLTPQARDAVIAYTDKDSYTYGKKGRSVEAGYPNMSSSSAPAHGSDLFNRPNVRTAIAEILGARDTGYKVRVNHTADLAVGRIEQRTITEQVTVDEDGKERVTSRSVTTAPTPASVQLAALKKLSRDTGEDAVVGVQNKMIHDDLLKMGTAMLRDHQRSLEAQDEPVEPVAVDEPAETQSEAIET